MAGEGDLLPVSALPVDGTWPTGTTQWEKRNIALEIPVWDADAVHPVRQVRRWSARTRPSAPRSTSPALLARRAGDVQVAPSPRARNSKGMKYTLQVAPGRLHRLRAVRRGLPGQEQDRGPSTRPSTWQPQPPAARAGARQLGVLPGPARARPRARCRSARQGRAAPAAAVRVLRRLRRLRRDAVRQAADPAVRRPRADRQRHRLLVDLRRQPADHAVHASTRDGRGPAWSNSLFEDNAEFGLGMRLAVDKQAEYARELLQRAGRPSSATSWSRRSARRRPVHRGRHRRAARARGRA